MAIEMIAYNGKFEGFGTFDQKITAVAIKNKRFFRFGTDKVILPLANETTQLIDLKGKLVIPGLHDSHLHLIRGGLSFHMELRWDGITSLKEALAMLKAQAQITPPPQWVRVVGGGVSFNLKKGAFPL